MKLGKRGEGSYCLTLPIQIVNAKGWMVGDTIKATIDKEGNIVLKKIN